MKVISKAFATLLLTAVGAHMADATTLTYAFTGVVTAAVGSFATFNGQSVLGDAVAGTYVLHYDAAIPSQSFGTPGSGSWSSRSDYLGNFPVGGSLTDSMVFTSTAQVVGTGISYATFGPDTSSNIGSNAGGSNGTTITAAEHAHQVSGGDTESAFNIASNTAGVYDGNGGPVYLLASPPGAASGRFSVSEAGNFLDQITYDITSISAVPLPAAGWLTLSALSVLGVLARKPYSHGKSVPNLG